MHNSSDFSSDLSDDSIVVWPLGLHSRTIYLDKFTYL
jgi:hypothetical protein